MTVAIIALSLVIAALLAVILWLERCHGQERRDLYSRLMAHDLADYAVTSSMVDSARNQPERAERRRPRNFVRAGMARHAEGRMVLDQEAREAGE